MCVIPDRWCNGFADLILMVVLLIIPAMGHAENPAGSVPGQVPAPTAAASPASDGAGTIEEGALTEEAVEVQEIKNVTISGDRISVEFRDIPLADALNEIGAMANFGVVTDEQVKNTPVSVKFKDQLLEKGLTRIIRLAKAVNFRFYYREDGTLETVVAVGATAVVPTQAEANKAATKDRAARQSVPATRRSRMTSPAVPATSPPPGGVTTPAVQPRQVTRPSVPAPPSARMRTPVPLAPRPEEPVAEEPEDKP